MKTLKNFFTCLETEIKKFFLNEGIKIYSTRCGNLSCENKSFINDVELMRQEEYISRYRSTTRWQTV